MGKKGSVLMISLWIMAILAVFAIGMAQRAMMSLRIVKYQKEGLSSSYAARSGIMRAIAEIKRDTNSFDSLAEPWSTGKDTNGVAIFEDMPLTQESPVKFSVKVTDEESKININTAARDTLKELLAYRGIENPDKLADLICDWIDPDTTPSGSEPEDSVFKNAPLVAPEELLLVFEYFYSQALAPEESRQKAQETYSSIKDLISLWAQAPNVNTVSADTLNIIMYSFAASADKGLVPAFSSNIIGTRENLSDKAFTDISAITLSDPQYSGLLDILKNQFGIKSNFFKTESNGYTGNITKTAAAVYDKTAGKIIYRRNN